MGRKKKPEFAGNGRDREPWAESTEKYMDRKKKPEFAGNGRDGEQGSESAEKYMDREQKFGSAENRMGRKQKSGNAEKRMGREKASRSARVGTRIDSIKKYLKVETEVEIFACAHITGMVFLYGLFQWLVGNGSVPFEVLLEQMVLGYVNAWVQKALFLGEKSYTDKEYWMRGILWCMVPGCATVAAGILWDWFPRDGAMAWWFYGLIFAYFILLWLFLEKVYRKETEEINQLLEKRKKKMEGTGD